MYDHVIVGAGSAGCVLASRLSADPSLRVLLLEAGGPDDRREIGVPAAFSKLFHTEVDWDYWTVPQPHLDDRSLYWPRGRVLGGTSSMNAMMWVRGVPADFDAWAEAGATGWGFADVLPYFRRSEDSVRGGTGQGVGGPIRIEEQRDPNPGTHLFVAACRRAGIPRNPNANSGTNLGVDYTQVSQRRGRRVSSADAYLAAARSRPNLAIETGAHVLRLDVEGTRVVGVTYRHGDEVRTARARREVVLAAGAINSPHLLMLSGIGPADHLRDFGIDPVVDLPGVGSNLSDHLASGVIMRTTRTDSLVAAETPRELLKYLVRRRGMLTSNVGEAHAFLETRPGLDGPDLELIFAPVPYLDHGDTVPDGHGYTIAAVLLQPRSRGTVRLASPDPAVPPLIDPAYLTADGDLDTLVTGMEWAGRLFATEPLAAAVTTPIRPDAIPEDREGWLPGIRAYAQTLYHPAGTAAMGRGPEAVVDPELRVRGVEGLRVADVSVIPTLHRGHTHAVAVMIGEKAADMILAG